MHLKQKLKDIRRVSACPLANKLYQKSESTARWIQQRHISANFITLLGLGVAILGLNFLAIEQYFLALLCLLLNRICDILDGITARLNKITPFGAFFDIFADYTSLALFLWGFILAQPQHNATAGAFSLTAVIISAAALLSFASMSGQDYKKLNRSRFKICLWGSVQNLDTFIILLIMCIFPSYFMPIAVFFGLLSLGKALLIVSGAYYSLEIAAKAKHKNETF